MLYFNGFDIDGTPCKVEEYGSDIGIVNVNGRRYQAIRLAASTYMATNGQIYAANQNNCISYATPEWTGWARRQMYSMGFLPNF